MRYEKLKDDYNKLLERYNNGWDYLDEMAQEGKDVENSKEFKVWLQIIENLRILKREIKKMEIAENGKNI